MKTALVILAVTAMRTGVCIAGVRQDAPSVWMRPVREFGTVSLGDITYPGQAEQRRVMRPFDIVEFTLDAHRPEPPFAEDWVCDFSRHRPRLLGTLAEDERLTLLQAALAEPESVWSGHDRSLGACVADNLCATFSHDEYAGKYEARLSFGGQPTATSSLPCTDLKWRAFGRALLAKEGASSTSQQVSTLSLTNQELRQALEVGERAIWLALGLTRELHGRRWPLVVGVHTIPDYEATVDYSTP
jgi:putative nucleic acid modification protein with dual OB domain